MLHKGVKFTHIAILIFSAMLAFLFVADLDEKMPLKHSALIWINQSDDAASGTQVTGMLESFAADHQVAIVRGLADLEEPSQRRHLYVVAGDSPTAPAAWLDSGYPQFNKSSRTDVHPATKVGLLDPRGVYFLYGPPETANALLAEFGALGLHGEIKHPLSISELKPIYLKSPLTWAFLVVLLATITVIGASVMLSARIYGVLRLQGASLIGIFIRDMQKLAAFYVPLTCFVGALTLGFLWFYNRLAWFSFFISVTAGAAAILTCVAVITHVTMLLILGKTELLHALKGDLPVRAVSISVYLVRIPALLIALAIAMMVISAGQDLLAREASKADYRVAGETTSISLNGSLGNEEKEMDTRVGGWIRQADLEGDVILAARRELQTLSPPGSILPQGEVLIVNSTFLTRQKILDPAGRRYLPPAKESSSDGPVQLIIPESIAHHAPLLRTAIFDNLNAGEPEVTRRAGVQTQWAKDGQEVFTYSTGDSSFTAAPKPEQGRSLVRAPVIIAVPNGSRVISDRDYVSYASQKTVAFLNARVVLDGISEHQLQTYVLSVTPIAQDAAQEQRAIASELRIKTFNLAIALAVLAITGLGACIVYSRKNTQAIFVRHISGWRFFSIHRSMLLTEALIAAILLSWPLLRVWWTNRELHQYVMQGIPALHGRAILTVQDIAISLGLVAIDVIAVLIALAVFHRRLIKERSTEA